MSALWTGRFRENFATPTLASSDPKPEMRWVHESSSRAITFFMTARDNSVEELYNVVSPDLMVFPCQQTESAWSIVHRPEKAISAGPPC